jgi:hypothetical protein
MSDYLNDEKFCLYELLNKYDRVLYLDIDIVVQPKTPDIFKEYPNQIYTYMLNESDFNSHITMRTFFPAIAEKRPDVKSQIDSAINENKVLPYYNVGVILASKCNRDLFKIDNYGEPYWRADQDFINYKILKGDFLAVSLTIEWNGIMVYDHSVFEKCNFIHYAGAFYDFTLWHYARRNNYRQKKTALCKRIPERYFIKPRVRITDRSKMGLFMVGGWFGQYHCTGVEIGSGYGETTEILAQRCKNLYAVDKWKDLDIEKAFDRRMVDFEQVHKINDIPALAAEGIKESLDFV